MNHTNKALYRQRSVIYMSSDAHYTFLDERLCLRPSTEGRKVYWANKHLRREIKDADNEAFV